MAKRTISLLPLALLALLVGCAEKPEPMAEPPKDTPAQAKPTAMNDNVNVVSPAAGLASPVTNSDSVAGSGGGGVQSAAKDQARSAAAKAGGGSLDQLGAE